MANLINFPSPHEVRNQVLKNNNQRTENILKYYVFGRQEYSNYKAMSDFYTEDLCKKKGSTNVTVYFIGPEDYPWDEKTKCQFLDQKNLGGGGGGVGAGHSRASSRLAESVRSNYSHIFI